MTNDKIDNLKRGFIYFLLSTLVLATQFLYYDV